MSVVRVRPDRAEICDRLPAAAAPTEKRQNEMPLENEVIRFP